MRKGFGLLILLVFSHFSLAQTGYGGPPESENTRIAREHQPGGLYNPNSSNGSGGSNNVPMWGAIAIDPIKFSRWGASFGDKGLQDVKDRALMYCEEGNVKCTVVVNYTRGKCGAVAITPKGFSPAVWSVEISNSRKSAEKAALKSCNAKLKASGIKGVKCENWPKAQCAVPGG